METKILITGGTGKVGSQLIKLLASQNVPVRAGVHDVKKSEKIAGPNVEIVPLDFDQPETIDSALQGIEKLCLITPPSNRQVDWAVLMVDKAKQSGVKHVFRLSVLAAQMEPGIQLGRWHRTVERYIKDSGLDWTIVRPGPFMQNFFGMYPSQDGKYHLPLGEGKVCHIDVRDVAQAIAKIVTSPGHEGKTYTLTGSEKLSMSEAVQIFSEATGKNISYTDVSEGMVQKAMMESGRPEWFVKVVMELFAAFKAGAVGASLPTIKEITGQDPITFKKFAQDFSSAFN